MGSTRSKVVKRGWCDIPVDRILPAPWNYKGEDEQKSTQLRGNLARNGQVESVIVRVHPDRKGYFEMVNGNHRLPEFKATGIKVVHAFNLGKVSQAAAARIAIETNDTRFQNDPVKLAGLLADLHKTFDAADLHATLPFSPAELDNYAGLIDFDWSQYDKHGTGPAKPITQSLSFDLDDELAPLWEQVSAKAAETGEAEPRAVLLAVLKHALDTGWKGSLH